MSNDQEKILSKIKKCLALADSNNPHESALALKRAQALMDKHNIEAFEIDVTECISQSKVNMKVQSYVNNLVTYICDGFGVEAVYRARHTYKTVWSERYYEYVSRPRFHQVVVFVGSFSWEWLSTII